MLEMVYDGHRVVLWDGAHLDSGEAEQESELETIGIDFADPDELALIRASVDTVSRAVTLVANILMSASKLKTENANVPWGGNGMFDEARLSPQAEVERV